MLVAWLGPEPALGDKIRELVWFGWTFCPPLQCLGFVTSWQERPSQMSLHPPLEQVIFVCTNHFVLVCVYVCKSAFYLRDNNRLCSPCNNTSTTSWFCVCMCSPWNIASATWEQEIPLTVEETLHHHSLRRKSIFKLSSCLQTWTYVSCKKTNSVSTTLFMKLVSYGLQTHLGLGGVDDNDQIWPFSLWKWSPTFSVAFMTMIKFDQPVHGRGRP